MTYKTRRRMALFVLLVGLPVYIVLAISVVGWMDRPSFLAELAVYIGLGFVWIVPMRAVFLGVGQPDPDAPETHAPKKPQP